MVGAVVGFLVGLTSVGSGTLIIVSIAFLFPRLTSKELVGTDIFQAFMLLASGAIAYIVAGTINWPIVGMLLIGSLPGVYLGSKSSKFIPERFNPEHGGLKAYKDKGVYLSFGDGPRICLGMRFALMQSKAAIAHLVKNFEITVNEKTQLPLMIDPKEFFNVKLGGVWLDFKRIN